MGPFRTGIRAETEGQPRAPPPRACTRAHAHLDRVVGGAGQQPGAGHGHGPHLCPAGPPPKHTRTICRDTGQGAKARGRPHSHVKLGAAAIRTCDPHKARPRRPASQSHTLARSLARTRAAHARTHARSLARTRAHHVGVALQHPVAAAGGDVPYLPAPPRSRWASSAATTRHSRTMKALLREFELNSNSLKRV